MSEEKMYNISLPEGVNELIIREGKAPEQLSPKAPVVIDITGTIESPFRFLQKRACQKYEDQEVQFSLLRSTLFVDRDKISLVLVINEDDFYNKGHIVGILKEHPKFKEFGINSDKKWEPNKLGQFFKMNRAFFLSRDDNFKLVSLLKNITVKVDQTIEKSNKENGSKTNNYQSIVESNLPDKFKLNIPLFIGTPAIEIEVELTPDIDGSSFTLLLISPGAAETLEDTRNSVIDNEIKRIQELCPNLVIIEQ